MCDRKNTLKCAFDMRSPRISAYHIHEWIHANLHLEEDDIRTLQIDGPRRRPGQLTFHHDNGELSQVTLELADEGTKKKSE